MNINSIQRAQLFGVFALLLGFAVWSPTGKIDEFPKFWWDESFTIETARTFNEIGVFDMTVAPNTPSGIAIALNANGFPLAYPLALLFRITGVSVVAARIMMLVWMGVLVGCTYQFFKKYLGHQSTVAGLLLVATFASFYANGRTATGDVPGLVFFVLALAALSREYFFATGILTALALVTKTSSFHVAPIAVGIAILFTCGLKNIRPLMHYISGGLLVALYWLWLLLPSFSWTSLTPAIAFFLYPTHKQSLISLALQHPTALITQSLILVVACGFVLYIAFRKQSFFPRAVSLAVALYTLLQIIVYVRSPGWSRYLLSVEFFMLLLLPFALTTVGNRWMNGRAQKMMLVFTPILIAAAFSLHYQFASDIFPRKNRDDTVRAIMTALNENPTYTIGFIDDPVTASLIPGNRKYQYIRIGGNTYAGNINNFTDRAKSPTYLGALGNDINRSWYMLEIDTPDFVLWRKK